MVCVSMSLIAGKPYSYKLLHSTVKSMEKLLFTLQEYGSIQVRSQTMIRFKILYQLVVITEFFSTNLVI